MKEDYEEFLRILEESGNAEEIKNKSSLYTHRLKIKKEYRAFNGCIKRLTGRAPETDTEKAAAYMCYNYRH